MPPVMQARVYESTPRDTAILTALSKSVLFVLSNSYTEPTISRIIAPNITGSSTIHIAAIQGNQRVTGRGT